MKLLHRFIGFKVLIETRCAFNILGVNHQNSTTAPPLYLEHLVDHLERARPVEERRAVGVQKLRSQVQVESTLCTLRFKGSKQVAFKQVAFKQVAFKQVAFKLG